MVQKSKDKYSKHDVTISDYHCDDCKVCPKREMNVAKLVG